MLLSSQLPSDPWPPRSRHTSTATDPRTAGLCHRRQWPEPVYQPHATHTGFRCVVRVNNREYSTDRHFESEVLATENAAMRAYLICRNFSVNDGRVPSGAAHRHAESSLQGRPVPIGTERRGAYYDVDNVGAEPRSVSARGFAYYPEVDVDGASLSSGSRSGGSSPGSADFPVSHRGGGPAHRPSRDAGRALSYGVGRRR